MIIELKYTLEKDYVRMKRYVYCEALHDNGNKSVEKLEVPKVMPDDQALKYSGQLFEAGLKKKGYEFMKGMRLWV